MSKQEQMGFVFKEARQRKGVSQLYVALELGQKSGTFISKIENGQRVPSLKTVKKITQILSISTDELAESFAAIEKEKVQAGLK